ncbi:MAG: type II toxin-antitoxin system HicA family toxin [Vulcanimicrobiaceae bacterium]
MPKLPRCSGERLIALLLGSGFTIARQRGSHVRLYGPDGQRVTVPSTSEPLPLGTLTSALRQAGWTADTLRKRLAER